ncbi:MULTISPECIES: aminotransferase class I/II-fold pyridoxal phosphate-dependent enzyme [Haloarcula]|uniref:8-amino-7-oxononanoate synthase n=1 Tax=Haloarcula pellucida TaxID=1427151 RepID=A0A830GIR4_9EURY|nr:MULTISPECIES: 8-amino-7-oxononanoate synthase [Halomicroarcula]MBX0347515.1 8-amino-7-oxononanoate synthase [Halomicroarcula pellucida]MDS0276611.1 8-amino-7-oxononanoate synthase [Halomicroarcula sp. S1AR25-4]GGN89048.1 8-amino-7-oxononanoate synthase [Halomicroarcula pellucida]
MTHGFDLGDRLRERERQDLRRHLDVTERVARRTRFADDPKSGAADFGEEMVVFAANNYLGLADDGRVQRAAEQGARTVGTGAGASRLVTGDTRLHRALERDLADCKGTERALVFSSGYAANVGTIDALAPDAVFSDELNHASIIDGCRVGAAETVVYDHCEADDLRAKMAERASTAGDGEQWLVVTDSVFSMDGDVAPLAALCDAAEEYGAWLMVDEAHATGLFGNGGGVVQREGLSDRVDIQLGTLSKALASQGGYVAGDEELVEYLLNAARSFVFSTGLAPPAAGAAREALRIARETDQTDRLWETVETLREGLEAMGYEVLGETHILPVLVGDRVDALELDERLRDHGVVAPAIRPPTVPEGTSRIRVAPMATHTDADLTQCLDAFEAAGKEVGVL